MLRKFKIQYLQCLYAKPRDMIVKVMNVLVLLLYSSILIHGFSPDAMMITIIALIIKNKAGDLSDNNNRPIDLATIASKLFESLILSRISIF